MTPRRFFAVVDLVRRMGYRFVGFEEYSERLDAPSAESGHCVLLTFDDGYREVSTLAHDGLRSRKVPYHVFLPTDHVGRANSWDLSLGRRSFRHLDWDDVRRMSRDGVTFGSHGATHRDLTRVCDGSLEYELVHSKREIERATDHEVKSLSYPFGRCDARVVAAAQRAGYSAGFSLYPKRRNASIDPMALRREAVYIVDTDGAIRRKLAIGRRGWFEEMKCRAINGVAVLTPILKGVASDRGRQSRSGCDSTLSR